ncbi:hypothetical protein F183_A34880 [Bryobacterales bacterium F-183]|nr:hypothetical protein F183_A34880 [Bryobacterales bacterium F-183]
MRTLPLLVLACVSASFAADVPNAVFVMRNSQVAPAAMRQFRAELKGPCDCEIVNENVSAERLAKARVLFLEHPSPQFLDRMRDVLVPLAKRGSVKVVTDVAETVQRAWDMDLPAGIARRMMPYWQGGGQANMVGFFQVAYQEAGGTQQLAIAKPVEQPRLGVYHPKAPQTYGSLSSYLAWYRKANPSLQKLAVVTFFPTQLHKADMAHIDALLLALEKQGLAAAGVFGWPHNTTEAIYDAPISVMLSTTLGLSRPEDAVLLEKQNVHVIGLMTTRDTNEQWASSERGVTPERVSTSLSEPERNGATDPILFATTETNADGMSVTMPIGERVEMAAKRARRWVVLRDKPNHEKRLAMLYYNNPPGKGNIGASYLNIAPSLRNVLETLRQEGYLVGNSLPSADQILDQLEKTGRNIETWAPGELDKMLSQGGVTLLPMATYRQWFRELPERFRRDINARWGEPEKASLMTWSAPDGRKFFVIPGIRLGNVFLGPQLLRSSFAEYTNVQHSGTLPPHHGYVASYLYYRHQLQADAVLHMGRHGTLEWLPGKNAGQAGWDASEAILGDLPNLYYYIMDGDGEAIQARRRSAAVDLSHLTPMLVRTGKEARFAALEEAVSRWKDSEETSPLLAAEYKKTVVQEAAKLGIDKQLGGEITADRIEEFLEATEDAPIPLGLPTLGVAPSEDRQVAAAQTFFESAFQPQEMKHLNPVWVREVFDGKIPQVPADSPVREKILKNIDELQGWLGRLRESPQRELLAMVRVLRGEYLPSGIVGDPLGVPGALPSGRNLHQGDPARLPTKAAWEVGKRLAKQLLERHKAKNGRYPERISMVLWQGETGRHQGAMEAQAMYLMGVEPEWNARGAIDRLKLIPEGQLGGRPRVNVLFTVSGLYRDGLADKIIMLDRASRLAASAGDNPIRRQTREIQKELMSKGMSQEEAEEMAGARVFTTAPGAYGFGLSQFVEQSRDKDEPETMAQLYLSKMNFAYTEKSWGKSTPKLLDQQLRGNETILHSRSSNLYGAVDNDDVYQWMGGLRVASESVGAKPELLINNMRRPGQEKLQDARGFIATELNARNWNPRWIAEMQKEGYSGGRLMARTMENLYGWQATAPEALAPEVWKKMYDVYVADEYKLGIREFLRKSNPAAMQNMVARLLEIDRQGVYRFAAEDKAALLREYVKTVSQTGLACSANICGNRRLQENITREVTQTLGAKAGQELRAELQQAWKKPSPVASASASAGPSSKQWKMPPPMKIVRAAELVRRVVRENPLAVLGVASATVGLGVVLGLLRRRRRMGWAALELAESAR